MPDVIIKGMEKMPPRCRECFAVQLWDDMDYCQIAERWQPWDAVTRPDWCPLRPAPEWISVEERSPEIEGDYLVWTDLYRGHAYTDYYVPGIGWDEYEVLAWMPLPEPPKEDEKYERKNKVEESIFRNPISECEESSFRIGKRVVYNRNDSILCRFNAKEVALRDTWTPWSNAMTIGEPPYWGLKHSW